MKKERTEAAQVAAIIRAEIKKHGISAKVRSENYSGGNSVDVYVKDLMPATLNKIESFCKSFQGGYFDSMNDMYVSQKTNGPSAKFVFVNCEYSEELKQECWEWVRGYYADAENAPENLNDAGNTYIMNGWASDFVWKTLRNDGPFWRSRKPRIQVAA